MPSLLPLHSLSGHPTGHRGEGNAKTPGHLPCNHVAAILFLEMYIFMEYGIYHSGAGDPLLHLVLPGTRDQDQRPATQVGGQRRAKSPILGNNPSQPTPRP